MDTEMNYYIMHPMTQIIFKCTLVILSYLNQNKLIYFALVKYSYHEKECRTQRLNFFGGKMNEFTHTMSCGILLSEVQ